MAYTIISQNNSTTTLSDGVNTITVPSRVNLTSGNFTIVEVNNNMATLEDGDGNVYRDIPCVATLAGEGGGGGTVDKSKIVNADTIPTASASNSGYVYLYTGTTNASYTHGYVYQNVKSATYTGTVSFEAATLSGTTVACSGDNFATFLTEAGADPTPIVSGTMTYEADATGWRLVGKDSDGNTVTTFMEYVEDYQDAGFTFTGTPQDGDVIAFTCSVTEASATYTWTRIDVQPQASGLPDQTGHSGEFLTTDGTDASWAAVNALQNTATGTDSLTILGTASTVNNSTNIGVGSKAAQAGGVAIGKGASVDASGTNAQSVAIGLNTTANGDRGVAIGSNASAPSKYGIAIGGFVNVLNNADGAIQLGNHNSSGIATSQNQDAHTFKVGLRTGTNYELLSSDGTIPTARFTTDPVSDGTYVPTLTISSGVATRSWSAPSGGLPSQTGNAGKFLTTDGTDASWSDKPLVNTATGTNCFATDTSTATGYSSLALGHLASAAGYHQVVLSTAAAYASANYAIVIGNLANAYNSAPNSIAIGPKASVNALNTIQLNASTTNATNSDANTFKVANANGNFEIMSADGTIPVDRLASTTGLADGNYKLRLTMSNGTPTLTWVAE